MTLDGSSTGSSAVVLFTWVRNVIGYTHTTDPPAWMLLDGEYVRYAGEVGWELSRVVAQMLGFGLVLSSAALYEVGTPTGPERQPSSERQVPSLQLDALSPRDGASTARPS